MRLWRNAFVAEIAWFWATCNVDGCLTRYGFRRLICSEGQEAIVFETSRDLLEGPLHPSWKVQIEQDQTANSRAQCCEDEQWGCQGVQCASRYEGLVICDS
jgi:hypothetical protein